MKNIEIKTTQNVALEYELADLRDRVVAFMIDFVVIMVTISVLSAIGFPQLASDTSQQVFAVFLASIFIFYSLLMEVFNRGQSLGKMAMKIQVIKTVGGQATFSDYAARWVFRMIDIYFSFGGIASVLVASSDKAQRIGDMVANTTVIKLTPQMDLKLEDLLNIQTYENYTPLYNEAKELQEDDVLLIKSTISRYEKYQNDSHKEAIHLMAEQIKSILGVSSQGENNLQFLKNVMKDYVVLTR